MSLYLNTVYDNADSNIFNMRRNDILHSFTLMVVKITENVVIPAEGYIIFITAQNVSISIPPVHTFGIFG